MLSSPEHCVHEVARDLGNVQVSLKLVCNFVLRTLLRDASLESLIEPIELPAPVGEHHVDAGLELVAHDGVGGPQLVQGNVPLLVELEAAAPDHGLLDDHQHAGDGGVEAAHRALHLLGVRLQQLLAPRRTLYDLDESVVVAHQSCVQAEVFGLAYGLFSQ